MLGSLTSLVFLRCANLGKLIKEIMRFSIFPSCFDVVFYNTDSLIPFLYFSKALSLANLCSIIGAG